MPLAVSSAARARLAGYLEALARPEIECISVKASTISSPVSSLAYEHTVEVLSDRLEMLYREAAARRFTRSDGTEVAKFVYLDMEEYVGQTATVTARAAPEVCEMFESSDDMAAASAAAITRPVSPFGRYLMTNSGRISSAL